MKPVEVRRDEREASHECDRPGGAAWGALAGTVIARRRTQQAKAQASQQVEQQNQQAQQATAEQIENFKKAFSVSGSQKLHGQVLG